MFDLKKDIQRAIEKYPALRLVEGNKRLSVQGTFTAYKDDIQIEPYEIEIWFPSDYPFSFPWVYEVGNKILPKNATRHINVGGTLCLGNPFDEAKLCKRGINLIWFLDAILNPHLCREYVREIKGSYITGERSHGVEGVWESFYELYGTHEKKAILDHMERALHRNEPGRNDRCYCGSVIKYKNCHGRLNATFFSINRNKAEAIFNTLKTNI